MSIDCPNSNHFCCNNNNEFENLSLLFNNPFFYTIAIVLLLVVVDLVLVAFGEVMEIYFVVVHLIMAGAMTPILIIQALIHLTLHLIITFLILLIIQDFLLTISTNKVR